MLLQQREATPFTNRDNIAAQLKLADQAESIRVQKRLIGTNDDRRRKSLLGYTGTR